MTCEHLFPTPDDLPAEHRLDFCAANDEVFTLAIVHYRAAGAAVGF
jgi:hypothetical protein